jgi:hypothetical protein
MNEFCIKEWSVGFFVIFWGSETQFSALCDFSPAIFDWYNALKNKANQKI